MQEKKTLGQFFKATFDGLSIRQKLISTYVLIAIIPALLMGVYTLGSLITHANNNAQRTTLDKLRIGELLWEVEKQTLVNTTQTIAQDNLVILNRDLGLNQALTGYLLGIKDKNELSQSHILNEMGTIIASTESESNFTSYEEQVSPYLTQAQEAPFVTLGRIKAEESGSQLIGLIAIYPIFNYTHILTGYAVGIIILNDDIHNGAWRFLSEVKSKIAVPFFLLDGTKMYYASKAEFLEATPQSIYGWVESKREDQILRTTMAHQNYLLGAVRLDILGSSHLSLAIAFPANYYQSEQLYSVLVFTLVVLGSLIVALIVGLWVAHTLSKPMVAIANGARAIVAGNFETLLPVNSKDEIGQMAEEFNEMTKMLSKTMVALAREVEEHMTAEVQVRELNNDLEARVQARTQDLTNANQALAESLALLRKTQKNLVETEKMAALGNLVGGIAHELNTPIGVSLTAISSVKDQTQLLEKLFTKGTMSKHMLSDYLQHITAVEEIISQNLQRTIDRIEFFKQISMDRDESTRIELNLQEYVGSFIQSFYSQNTDHFWTMENNIQQGLTIKASPGSLYQILFNLASNSVHHGFDGRSEGTMVISSYVQDREITLTFSDDGVGIPNETIPRIFEPFYSTKKSGTRSGLGLSVVYNLVTSQFGGAIYCESNLGQGTTFLIHLPL